MFPDNFFQYLQSVIDIVRIAGNCPTTSGMTEDPVTETWYDLYHRFECRKWTNCGIFGD